MPVAGLKQWYSAAELAALRLPNHPSSERFMRERVKKEGWKARQVEGKGGRNGLRTEYKLPQTLLSIVKERAVQTLLKTTAAEQPEPDTAVARMPSVKPAVLKDWQRETAQAPAAICNEVHLLAEVAGTERAIRTVIELAAR